MKKISRIATIVVFLVVLSTVFVHAIAAPCTAGLTPVQYNTAPRLAPTTSQLTTPTMVAATAPTSAAFTFGADFCTDAACATSASIAPITCSDGTNQNIDSFFAYNAQAQETGTGLIITDMVNSATTAYVGGYYASGADQGKGFIASFNPDTGAANYVVQHTFGACAGGIYDLDLAYDTGTSTLNYAAGCDHAATDGIILVELDGAGAVNDAVGKAPGGAYNNMRLGIPNPTTQDKQLGNVFGYTDGSGANNYYAGGYATTAGGDTAGWVARFTDTFGVGNGFSLELAGNDPAAIFGLAQDGNDQELPYNSGVTAVGYTDVSGAGINQAGLAVTFQAAVTVNVAFNSTTGDVKYNQAGIDATGDDIAFGGTIGTNTLLQAVVASTGADQGARAMPSGEQAIGVFADTAANQFVFASDHGGDIQVGLFNPTFSFIQTGRVDNFNGFDSAYDPTEDELLVTGNTYGQGGVFAVQVVNGGAPQALGLVLVDVPTVSDSFYAMTPMFGAEDTAVFAGTAGNSMVMSSMETGYTGTVPEFSLSTLLLTILVAGGIMMFVVRRRYN